MKKPLFSLVVAAALAAAASAAPRGFESQDIYRLRAVRDVRISPDGSRIAYRVQLRDRPGRPYDEAWVLDVASSAGRRFLGDASVSSLRWSPDGGWIACLVSDGKGAQLAVARPDGSSLTRLAPVSSTNHPLPSAGETLAWSPDGRRIAFVSATPGPEPPAADPVVITRYLYKPPAGPDFNDNRRLHVFVADVATRQVRQLTRGDGHEHSIAWSPSGREIVFVSNQEPDADRVFNYDLLAVAVDTGAVRRISQTPSAEYTPAWSPDGRTLAYLGTKRPLTSSETTMEDTHVWLIGADGARPLELGAALDNRQDQLGWDPDGSAVLVSVEERGSQRLYRLPTSGGAVRPVLPPPAEPGELRSWSIAKNGAIAYALGTPVGPADLYLTTAAGTRRLTSLNVDLMAERTLAPVEAFRFLSFDGTEIEAFLTRPHGLSASSRHPLVVWIHGGPHGQQGPGFDPWAQTWATQGWATLMVNYRGSTGYGQKLADAIFGDQDGGEAKDVLAGVDAALARYPWLDPERLAIGGGSYGGQLTNWIITQTDRFRAAAPVASISNLVSFNYMAYYHDYLAVEFGSYPHQGGLMDRLWERSPLRYVAKVRTPVLFLHGEEDNDVPIAEAEQFFIALKDVGVETVMVRYPREGHGLRETKHLVDGIDRTVAWFKQHFELK